ncbi:MAG: tetratricopeptide repeat protein [Planctomycetota bacterium]|jgi:tetratricopeptide (TPR) repeat protein|nr:tetratricopeptide repeat protein [Planctomycetota bacterium]
MKHVFFLLSAFVTSCATSAPPQAVAVNEVRHLSEAEVERMESVDIDEWNAARSNILRTFAFRALENNLIEEAREYLSEACEINAEDTACHAALARLYLAEGETAKALAYSQRAHAVAPDNPEISMVYAAALAESGDTSAASEALESTWVAIENDPSFARVILTHYAATGQTDQAQDFVSNMLQNSPNHASSWTTSGDLLLAQGDLSAAAEAYRTAIKIDAKVAMPDSIRLSLGHENIAEDPMFAAALRAEQNGDFESAHNLLNFLIERDPQNDDFRLAAARVNWAQRKLDYAQSHLNKVAISDRDWRGHLLQAKLDISRKQFAQARTTLQMAAQNRDGIRSVELLMSYVEQNIQATQAETESL